MRFKNVCAVLELPCLAPQQVWAGSYEGSIEGGDLASLWYLAVQ